MCCPASWAAIGAAVIGATGAAYSADQSRQAAHQQQDAAAAAAKAAGTPQKATAADTSAPGVGTPATAGVNSGPASTLLTGAGGISNSKLNLGSLSGLGANNLLGQ